MKEEKLDDILMMQNFTVKGRKTSLTFTKGDMEGLSPGSTNDSLGDSSESGSTRMVRKSSAVAGKTNIPSLRQIRKTRTSNNGETSKTDIFGKTVTGNGAKKVERTMRSAGCQHGTPRLETRNAPMEPDKSSVDIGATIKKRQIRKTKGRGTFKGASNAPADLPFLDEVADGVLKEIDDGAKSSPSGKSPRRISAANSPKSPQASTRRSVDFKGSTGNGAKAEEKEDEEEEMVEEQVVIDEKELASLDSDEEEYDIDMEQAGSMFQGLGDAVVAKDFNSKFHVGWKLHGRNLLKSSGFSTMVAVTTIYAIVGMEIAEAALGSRDYVGLHICSFLSLLFFTFEIVLSCLCIEHYNLSFFFWLDLVGTISLLPDVAFLWPEAWALDGLALARAGRVARTGTRAVRIVRFFRIIRMLRLFRVVKLLSRGRHTKDEDENQEGEKKENDEMNAYRSRLAKRHAAVVEMRVVTGVILMLIVMPSLEYVQDFNTYLALEMVQQMLEANATNTTISNALELYKNQEDTLVYISAGDFSYQREPEVPGNVIKSGLDINNHLFPDVNAQFELTEEIKDTAVLNILLTLFLAFLFALGSFVFNNDAHELMFQPIARLTEVTSKVSSQLFNIGADAINGSESSYIESVLTKVARFFDTEMHKVTTLYTPDDAVWTIDVRREKEEVARVVGSTHRITSGDLHNMMQGAKKTMVQRLMFIDFLNDPLAVRYFHTYLAASNDKKDVHKAKVINEFNEDNLLFWEEIRRYRRAISSATFQARHIFKTYVHPEADSALDLSAPIIQALYDEVFVLERPGIETFDKAEQDVIEIMRMRYFPAFLASEACKGLVIAKKGLPKAIMVENEFDSEEIEERKMLGGEEPKVELNLTTKAVRKRTALGGENKSAAAAAAAAATLTAPMGLQK